jgi:LysM repeat protein
VKLTSKIVSVFVCLYLLSFPAVSQKFTAKDYIDHFKEDAVKEMYLNRIPASIVLAQAMFESANGNSELAKNANNHFGIKCKKEWCGDSYSKDDEEEKECFRKYVSVLESYTDHSNFLRTRPRYSFLFEIPVTDYKAWCYGLKEAGYATDPKYAKRLIDIIEKYKLYELDKHLPIEKPEFPGLETDLPELDIREVYRFNRGKFIITKQGDSFFKIASEFNLELEKLMEYNDINRGDKIEIGQKLFLEPKRDKAKEPYHVVQKGETLRQISQIHGIKLTILCKNNHLKPESDLKAGEILYLRGKKPFEALHLTSKGNSFN